MYLNIIKFQNGDSQFLEASAYLYYQDMITSAEGLFHTIVACQEIFLGGGAEYLGLYKGITKFYQKLTSKS